MTTSDKPFVITIVGAESSGKTTLAQNLALRFGCPLVQEYARDYLSQLQRPYDEKDLERIAVGQEQRIDQMYAEGTLNLENFFSNVESEQGTFDESLVEIVNLIKSKIENRKSKILIVDGGMLTFRMWARIKFNQSIHVVEKALTNDVTSLYLLCRPRKAWTSDPLREAPRLLDRAWIYNQYLNELSHGHVPFEIVNV